MKKYRILWERTQQGNTMVNANSIEEATEIATNQVPLNKDITDKTKQQWHFVGVYCTEI